MERRSRTWTPFNPWTRLRTFAGNCLRKFALASARSFSILSLTWSLPCSAFISSSSSACALEENNITQESEFEGVPGPHYCLFLLCLDLRRCNVGYSDGKEKKGGSTLIFRQSIFQGSQSSRQTRHSRNPKQRGAGKPWPTGGPK